MEENGQFTTIELEKIKDVCFEKFEIIMSAKRAMAYFLEKY